MSEKINYLKRLPILSASNFKKLNKSIFSVDNIKKKETVNWTANIAHNLIESVSFEIGGDTVQKLLYCSMCNKFVESHLIYENKVCISCYIYQDKPVDGLSEITNMMEELTLN